jgi:aminotransferase
MRYLGLTAKTTSGMDSLKEKKSRWWEYEMDTVSGRFISNDVFAAIGREQLKKLPSFIARRKEIWEFYQSELSELSGLTLPPEPLPETTTSYYLYWIQLKRRDELAVHLLQNGVYSTFRYFPLHMVNRFRTGCKLPHAELANETTLNLPLHQNLSDSEVEQILHQVKKFFR